MNSEDLYRAWAPPTSPWSPWVKPVLFATAKSFRAEEPDVDAELAKLRGLSGDAGDTFVIVNHPGARSVATGLALAQLGFRPVPLFNGVDGPLPLIPVGRIVGALVAGATSLGTIAIPPGAPPAFLLDANRMLATPKPRMLDNRWLVVPEDFPSANRLLAAGHRNGVILGDTYGEDLAHVLVRFDRGGVALSTREATGALIPHQPSAPRHFGSLFARTLVLVGLRRSSAGGFGGIVPDPSNGGGSGFG